MNAILIDDEPLALRDLERQIRKIGGVDIAATYYDPIDAIAELPSTRPCVVFIDIDMPDLNGLEAAEQMLQFDSSIDVVFVTAYEEYAVKAFDLNALDYLLKPLNPERLARTLDRIAQKQKKPAAPKEAAHGPSMIRSFQQASIENGNGETFHWRTTKAQELFAYLVYRRHQQVRKDVLIEVLWPHVEMKRAYSLLYTTIYQLRKSFESSGLPFQIKSSGNGYSIFLGNAVLEAEEWENGLNAAPPLDAQSLPHHLMLMELYRGDFLADHDYPWADIERERLRTLWYQHALSIGLFLQENNRLLEAAAIHLRIQKVYPHSESNYWMLIQLYAKVGDRNAVMQYYRQFVEMLEEEYGEEPSAEMADWYERWLEENGN